MLEARNICFSYTEKQVLSDVSFTISPGEMLCIMGPNGCGKSTLVDCILGINMPQSGQVLLNGRPARSYSQQAFAREVAFVPQNHLPTFPYSVREAVMMGRTAYVSAFGTPAAEDYGLCEEAMKKAGIFEFADRPYSSLSGGELRMVLFARALCQGTGLILMDEPTAHLDYRNEMIFLERVSELCTNEGISVLITTHSPQHAFFFESKEVKIKTIFMKSGRVVCEGAPSDVITADAIREVYGIEARIMECDGMKAILPLKSV